MVYTIKNTQLTVSVQSKGGELWSIRDHLDQEYLWQGDKKYWQDRGFHLFPYIARLTNGTYLLDGKEYSMDIHGFLKDMEMQLLSQSEDCLILGIEDTQETRVQYPFHFCLRITFRLTGKRLDIEYNVNNLDSRTMYFGIGGHPGFHVPMEEGFTFEDYHLTFDTARECQRVGMSEDCFVTGRDIVFGDKELRTIALSHELFDEDAIILKDMAKRVTLSDRLGRKSICVNYPQMNYLGIWHMPHTDAPYVCIEPWTSLPSRKGIVEKLDEQENLISLRAGEAYQNCWSIELGSRMEEKHV